MRLVNSGEAKCPLVYGNGEWRVQTPKHLVNSVESHVCLSLYGSGICMEGGIRTVSQFPLGPLVIFEIHVVLKM
jgi:hypothetical protein